uniref:G-protein coupled receptors family 1 profile domain-containing protein n=1 Tax=Lates calcarifer TaxID=8187 RepID=A0A4W6G694_LATCA
SFMMNQPVSHRQLYTHCTLSAITEPKQRTAATDGWLALVISLLAFFFFNLVFCIFNRYTKMKTATNIYIFNLALADALVTTTMPSEHGLPAEHLAFGEVVCKVFISIDYYNMFTSIFTLTMMSVDRYVAVCHPVKALDFRTPIKAKMINVCIWILSSAAGIPAFILGAPRQTACALQFPEPYVYYDTLMKICVFVFAFVVPVLIITVRSCVPETTAIMAAYFFCVALGYTNSSLNPVLYAFLDENFQTVLQRLLPLSQTEGRESVGDKTFEDAGAAFFSIF